MKAATVTWRAPLALFGVELGAGAKSHEHCEGTDGTPIDVRLLRVRGIESVLLLVIEDVVDEEAQLPQLRTRENDGR